MSLGGVDSEMAVDSMRASCVAEVFLASDIKCEKHSYGKFG